MKKAWFLFAGLSGLLSCSEKENNLADQQLITYNDFEGLAGWAGELPSLTTEKAHSGKYSAKVDSNVEFSLTYQNQFGKISTKKPKKIKIEAWFFCTEKNHDANFALSIHNDKGTVFYDAIKLNKEVEESKEWVKVSKEIPISETVQFTDIVKVYLWRAGSAIPIYMDDVKVSIVE